MPENIMISKMLQDIILAANNTLLDDQVEKQFSQMIGSFFGIDRVMISTSSRNESSQNELYGYVSNTKKIYIDNQLSEYSSFPELITYKNRGFRSCAILPIVVGGRVVSIVEMLSNSENKFSNDLISSASLSAYMTGLTLLYKYESDRNLKLASYFNSAFSSNSPQILVSNDGKIVKSNDAAFQELISPKGSVKSIDELVGMSFAQLLQLSKKGSAQISFEKDNQTHIYRIASSMVNDKLVHVSMNDVTELKRLGMVLESMDQQSYIGAMYLDKELTVKSATESIKKTIGYDRNLVIGKNLIELIIEKQRGEIQELISNSKKERVHGSMDLATSTGIPAHLRFVISKWQNGYLMLFSDATSEGYVDSIKDAFTDFINSTSDIVITMDAVGFIKDCNLSVENALGYQKSELIGKDLRTLYMDQSILERDLTYVRNGGKVDSSYIALAKKDGVPMDATHAIRLFRGAESTDYIIVVKELETKRRLTDLEDDITRERNVVSRLTARGELKSQFIYNISHELKTPLTNIKGFSKLLYTGEWGDLNKDQLNYLSTIIEETDRLLLIIQQILDASKLESSKMKLEFREVDLKELHNNSSIQSMEELAKKQGLDFAWTVNFDVPKITADPNRLIQVFTNLIGNAIKFTDKGSIKVKISRFGKGKVQCDVTDTGIGIDEEDRHKLFKKFYEAPKKELVKQEGAGTGLGLSITSEIVRLHGGKITCESELGKGSTFSFTIRIKPKPKKENG